MRFIVLYIFTSVILIQSCVAFQRTRTLLPESDDNGVLVGMTYDKAYSSSRVKLNSVFGNIGGAPLVGRTLSIYYERIVYSQFPRPFVRAGYCSLHGERDYGNYMLQVGMLIGRKASNFELALGALYTWEISTVYGVNFSEYFVSGSAGYRYHKPTGGIILRIGGGYPEFAYVGLGFSF